VGKILLVLILAAVAFAVGKNLLAIAGLKSRLAEQNRLWNDVAPRKAQAAKLIQEASQNLEILGELQGWKTSRLAWAPQLLALAKVVPEQIQIRSLRVQHEFSVIEAEKVGRAYSLSMAGRSGSEGAEMHVESLRSQIKSSDDIGPVKEAEVPTFGEDPENRDERIFSVKTSYTVRSF
jgi:hypothetical protein